MYLARGVEVNHLPLLVERSESGEVVLLGHMARANPLRKRFVGGGGDVTVVFQGPHTYVTPRWYPDAMNVPTWNYAVVHAFGAAHLVEDFEGVERILSKTVELFESRESDPWKYELPEEFRRDLVRAIVGFEIRVSKLDAKFKLSQNREPADWKGVIEGLATRSDEMSAKVREMMLGGRE